MDFKIVEFKNVDKKLWDKWVSQISESTYLHTHMHLEFMHAHMEERNVYTFACVKNNDTPLAICPLGISKATLNDLTFLEGSWNGAPLGLPVIADMTPSMRAKVQMEVFKLIHSILTDNSAKRNYVRRHPINWRVLRGSLDNGVLSVMQQGYECLPQNTIVIDLKQHENDLVLQLSKFQRKHIKHSIRDGIKVKALASNSDNLVEIFTEYQEAHCQSAGKMTRPQRTFDLMLEAIKNAHATMFIATVGEKPISYLLCGEFDSFAFGWSQVNLDAYEREFSPRQFLEWSALMDYKRRGFRFYEVGTLWYGPQLYCVPTTKELSIAEFKRRFGGLLLADLCFEKFLEEDLWNKVLEIRRERFIQSAYFKMNTERSESYGD